MKKLLNYLEEVRSYPEAKRKQILALSTISITVLIVLLWGLNLWLLGSGGKVVKSTAGAGASEQIMAELANIRLGLTAVKEGVVSLWR